jgi:hypothetical protein
MSYRNIVIGRIIIKFEELRKLKNYIFLNRDLNSYKGEFILGKELGKFQFKTPIDMDRFIAKSDSLSDSIFYGIIQQYPLNVPIVQEKLEEIYKQMYELLIFFINLIKTPYERYEYYKTYRKRNFLTVMDKLIYKLETEVSGFYERPEEDWVYEGSVVSTNNNVNKPKRGLLPRGMPYVEPTFLLDPNMENSNKISLIIKGHKEKYEAQQERERQVRERRERERQERELRERERRERLRGPDNQPRGTPLKGIARVGTNRTRANNLRSRRAANRSSKRSAANRSGTSF